MRGFVLFLAWALATGTVSADQVDIPPDDMPPEVRAAMDADILINEGIALRETGDDAGALQRFERAHERSPSPRALTQIALAEAALGRWLAADEHLGSALQTDDEWIEARRTVLQAEHRRIAGRLGSLEVLCDIEGAELLVDGRVTGSFPLEPVRLVAGSVRIEIRADGYYSVRRTVDIEAGGLTRESITLNPRPSEPDPDPRDPPIDRDPADRIAPVPEPPPGSSGLRIGAVVALAGAGVTAATALAMFFVRENRVEEFNSDECISTEMTRGQLCGDTYDGAVRAERTSIAMLAATGALAAAGIVLFVLGKDESNAHAGVQCGPGPGDVGMSCGARF